MDILTKILLLLNLFFAAWMLISGVYLVAAANLVAFFILWGSRLGDRT